jgi:hypothetical protein
MMTSTLLFHFKKAATEAFRARFGGELLPLDERSAIVSLVSIMGQRRGRPYDRQATRLVLDQVRHHSTLSLAIMMAAERTRLAWWRLRLGGAVHSINCG